MRLGVLGGTFDPIHLGHLLIAEQCREGLALNRVFFAPAGLPWLKNSPPAADARHRLNMVELAVAGNPHFQALENEVNRPGPTYTVDTLEELRQQWGPEAQLHFILGQDAFASFARWREPERLLTLCRLVVVGRSGYEETAAADILAFSRHTGCGPAALERVIAMSAPGVDFSSTEIRRRVAAGQSIRYHLPDAVAQYIAEQGLYAGEAGGEA